MQKEISDRPRIEPAGANERRGVRRSKDAPGGQSGQGGWGGDSVPGDALEDPADTLTHLGILRILEAPKEPCGGPADIE